MPQISLEYSSNIVEKDKIKTLFPPLHEFLSQSLPTKISSCKSRVYECETFVLGDGSFRNAFIHMQISIMPGRTFEVLDQIGKELILRLNEFFEVSHKTLNLELTLEIRELKKTYYKIVSS